MNKATFLTKKMIAQVISDVVYFEDINYTVPEVQTLLDGITVGGKRLFDTQVTLNQIDAWEFLFESIKSNKVNLSKDFICKLHSFVAKEEALEWGSFRASQVYIAGAGDYIPPLADSLDNVFIELVNKYNSIEEPYIASIFLFSELSRNQFFYDGNKRTARMMMSGLLLSKNSPAPHIPSSKKTEFNKIMIEYYQEPSSFYNVFLFFMNCIEPIIAKEFNIKIYKQEEIELYFN